ncbi:MAG: recombinase family protein [Archangium sp.]|nr:recombinase family protein [Archangium sp.]
MASRRPPARETVRCAIYTRQSVARAGVDPMLSSCELQAERCLAFIDQRAAAGWRFVERFDDEGESGATMDRDGLFELLLAVEAGDVDHVVVHRVDRLSRKLVDLVRLLNFFEHFDVEVSFVDGALASMGGAMTRLQLSVLGTFAEFEHSIISERLRDAHGSRREQGLRSAGRLPFGYRSDRDTKQLVPYQPDAAFVRECFERAAAGVMPAILAADGAAPRRSGPPAPSSECSATPSTRAASPEALPALTKPSWRPSFSSEWQRPSAVAAPNAPLPAASASRKTRSFFAAS